jgi:hypothetical protein
VFIISDLFSKPIHASADYFLQLFTDNAPNERRSLQLAAGTARNRSVNA